MTKIETEFRNSAGQKWPATLAVRLAKAITLDPTSGDNFVMAVRESDEKKGGESGEYYRAEAQRLLGPGSFQIAESRLDAATLKRRLKKEFAKIGATEFCYFEKTNTLYMSVDCSPKP